MKLNIAIDGPSAAGKSTVADLLAKKLSYVHLDTGSMYRAVAYNAISKNIQLDDEESLEKMISSMKMDIKMDGSIFVDGNDVSAAIRENHISMAASDVSKLPKVRSALVLMQQNIASKGGYILDGRDIGTVVLKDAKVKIFLVASSVDRANRRYKQNIEKGIPADFDMILKDIEARDYQDTHREVSPLKKAEDAIEIDTSHMTIDEVVERIMEIVKLKLS